jgi:Spy/CpxP family protein refolding chaperone
MKKIAVLLFILPMFVLSYSAYAFHGHHGSMQWWKNTDVINALQLTNDQINSLNQIYTSNHGQISNLYSQLKSAGSTLKSTMGDPNSTMNQISSASNSVLQIKQQIEQAKMNMHLALIGVLNSQQRSALVQTFQSHRRTPQATPQP